MRKKRFASVWDAIEDTPEKAENMKLRSSLMIALQEHMASRRRNLLFRHVRCAKFLITVSGSASVSERPEPEIGSPNRGA